MFVKTNLGLAVLVGKCVVYSFKWLMVNSICWSILLAFDVDSSIGMVISVVSNVSISEVNELEFVFGNWISCCLFLWYIYSVPSLQLIMTEVPPLPAPLLLSPSLRFRPDLQVAVVGALQLHGESQGLFLVSFGHLVICPN